MLLTICPSNGLIIIACYSFNIFELHLNWHVRTNMLDACCGGATHFSICRRFCCVQTHIHFALYIEGVREWVRVRPTTISSLYILLFIRVWEPVFSIFRRDEALLCNNFCVIFPNFSRKSWRTHFLWYAVWIVYSPRLLTSNVCIKYFIKLVQRRLSA